MIRNTIFRKLPRVMFFVVFFAVIGIVIPHVYAWSSSVKYLKTRPLDEEKKQKTTPVKMPIKVPVRAPIKMPVTSQGDTPISRFKETLPLFRPALTPALLDVKASDETSLGKNEPQEYDQSLIALLPQLKPVWSEKKPPRGVSPQVYQMMRKPILSSNDRRIWSRVFALYEKGRFQQGDALIKLSNNRLLFDDLLLVKLFHPTAYRAKGQELASWLERNPMHPSAYKVLTLSKKRVSESEELAQPVPVWFPLRDIKQSENIGRKYQQSNNSLSQPIETPNFDPRWVMKIEDLVDNDRVTMALKRVRQSKNIDIEQKQYLFAYIVRGYYHNKRYDKALAIAQKAKKLADDQGMLVNVNTLWWGGLSSWCKRDYSFAAEQFSRLVKQASKRKNAPIYDQIFSMAAYWAARSYLQMGNGSQALSMLRVSASYGRSFYGFLARAALGIDHSQHHIRDAYTTNNISLTQSRDTIRTILNEPIILRARALFEIGQSIRAGEILRKAATLNAPLPVIITMYHMGIAMHLPSVSYRAAYSLEAILGQHFNEGLYPDPRAEHWKTATIDRALLLALIKKESGFVPRAQSQKSAVGLMQVLPSTASSVVQNVNKVQRKQLQNPAFNLDVGQQYWQKLITSDLVSGNLIYALVAYNAGLGNLSKWRKKMTPNDDPLLFMESVRALETRYFIKEVITNMWVYREKFQQSRKTLDDLLIGQWPQYVNLNNASLYSSIGLEKPHSLKLNPVYP